MDTNQDKREDLASNESSNSAEQMVLTSPVKHGNEQDAIETEDSCSRADKMYAEELTVDETYKVSDSETSEKVKVKYEKNLKKFLEATKSQNEIRSRRKKEGFEKIIKSDGEISKIRDFFGNMSKISTVLSKISLHPSSAPPTFSTISGQIPQNEKLSSTPVESDTSNVIPETNKTTSTSDSLKPSVSGKTENDSSQVKVLASSQSKSSGVFKLPTVLTCMKTLPDETSKNDSPGKSKIKESATTPTAIRPRDFNVQTRKTFYTFSPNKTTGVLRQCQSLPNINRPRRKQEKQRWSLVLGKHSQIVRSLFSDESEPCTSGTREAAVANIDPTGGSRAASSKDESKSLPQEESSLSKVSHTASQLDSKPKMCRKLTFALPSYGKTEKAETAVEAASDPKGKSESPAKRKEVSTDLVECSSSSVKKVRTALEFKRSDEDTIKEKMESIPSASEEVPKDYLKTACSSGEKVSPVKRKAQEIVEGSSSSKTKVKPSKMVSRL